MVSIDMLSKHSYHLECNGTEISSYSLHLFLNLFKRKRRVVTEVKMIG